MHSTVKPAATTQQLEKACEASEIGAAQTARVSETRDGEKQETEALINELWGKGRDVYLVPVDRDGLGLVANEE